MTERSYVWESILVGDATIAPYSSAEWAELQRFLVGASKDDYGMLAGTGNGTQLALEVQATGPASATVNLFVGAALCNGRLYINDATLNLAIGANASGNTRIDTIIIRGKDIGNVMLYTFQFQSPHTITSAYANQCVNKKTGLMISKLESITQGRLDK